MQDLPHSPSLPQLGVKTRLQDFHLIYSLRNGRQNMSHAARHSSSPPLLPLLLLYRGYQDEQTHQLSAARSSCW